MSEAEEDTFKAVELDQQAPGSASTDPAPTPVQPAAAEPSSPALQSPESAGPAKPPSAQSKENQWTSAVNQFKLKRFFVLRVMTHALFITGAPGLALLL